MPQAEAARRLGVSVTALKSRIRRGRLELKAMLLQCCEFELSSGGRVLDYWPRQECCADVPRSEIFPNTKQPRC
jgi:RNA polymerase sigma-70 factor (ECF subfamily)